MECPNYLPPPAKVDKMHFKECLIELLQVSYFVKHIWTANILNWEITKLRITQQRMTLKFLNSILVAAL